MVDEKLLQIFWFAQFIGSNWYFFTIIDVDLRFHSFIVTCVSQQLPISKIKLINIVEYVYCSVRSEPCKMPREDQSRYCELKPK